MPDKKMQWMVAAERIDRLGGRRPRPGSGAGQRLFCLLLIVLAAGSAVRGQYQFTLYQMPHLPQAHLLQPGYLPEAGAFIGLPLIGGSRAALSNNVGTYNDLFVHGAFDLAAIDLAGLRRQLHPGNRFILENDFTLGNAGIRMGKGYFSIDVSEHELIDVFHPEGLIQLLDDIQRGALAAGPYDLRGLQAAVLKYRGFALGYTHGFGRLSVGGRARLLQGKSALWTVNRALQLRNDADGNRLEVDGAAYLLSSGLQSYDDLRIFDLFGGGSGNYGYAFDAGLVYHAGDRLELSAGARNLGALLWKEAVNHVVLDEETASFSNQDLAQIQQEVGTLVDQLIEGPYRDGTFRFQTPLPQYYYLGGRYAFRPGRTVGALISSRVLDGVLEPGLSLAGSFRLGKAVDLTATYSLYNRTFLNIGLGCSVDLGIVQLYALADYLPGVWGWKNSRNAHLQIGLNLLFGNRRVAEGAIEPEEPIATTPTDTAWTVMAGTLPGEEAIPDSSLSRPVSPATDQPVSRFRILEGVIRDAATGAEIGQTNIEVFQIDDDGEPQLIYSGVTPGSEFYHPLERGLDHLVVIVKNGYEAAERLIPGSQDLQAGQEALAYLFSLQPHPLPAADPVEAVEAPAEEEEEADRYDYYVLTEKTSLREGPTHRTDVLLRFRPGNKVLVLQQYDQWWWRVRYEGREGYVKAFLLKKAE